MREPVIVLGGGLAGLSAAHRLGGDIPIYEQHTSLGGLCSQVRAGAFRFDAVPHVLHFQHDETFRLVQELLEGRMRSYRREARVYSHGTYTRYPFQAHLFGLPPAVIEACLQGRAAAEARGVRETATFERWIISTFGEGIANHFLIPYNTKFWTLPPSALTCDWIDGMVPVPTLEQTRRGAAQEDATEYGYNVEFWYPASGGLSALFGALLERLRRVRLGKRLVRVRTLARRLEFADGEQVEYDELLCSIPLPQLPALLDPLPPQIARAFDALRWTSLAVVHLGVEGPAPAPWHWAYVPQPELLCYRVGIPSHYAPDAAPAGAHTLSVEISYAPWRPLQPETVIPRVISELQGMGLLRSPQQIVAQRLLELRYGYPIYDHQYAWATTVIRRYLDEQGIHPIGRFGSWRYLSMEGTLLDGQQAADAIANRVGHEVVPR